jgi:hypothetical protein
VTVSLTELGQIFCIVVTDARAEKLAPFQRLLSMPLLETANVIVTVIGDLSPDLKLQSGF